MKKITLILVALMSIGSGVMFGQHDLQRPQKVPAIRTPIVRELPNGDSITILLRGDERKHWTMTVDGWAVKEKDNGYFYYQTAGKDGKLVTTIRKAHDEGKRKKCEKKWLEKKGHKY